MFDLPPRENLKTQLDTMSSGFKGDFFGGENPNGADFCKLWNLRSCKAWKASIFLRLIPKHSDGIIECNCYLESEFLRPQQR